MKYFLQALKNYTGFSGRSTRSEFWFFVLFYYIFFIILAIVDNLVGSVITINGPSGPMNLPYGYLCVLFMIAMIIPGLAVAVRRLHDVGKSGWFLLITLIPLIGSIWLIVLYATDSEPNPNKWGPSPKAIPLTNY